MTKLEITVHYTDGTSSVLATVEDTPEGRTACDKTALAILMMEDTEAVSVERVQRTAGYLRSR